MKLIVVFTLLIMLLLLTVSLAGAFSSGPDEYRTFTTARGETVQVQYAGIYRYSLQALVTAGIPWDFVGYLLAFPYFSFLLSFTSEDR